MTAMLACSRYLLDIYAFFFYELSTSINEGNFTKKDKNNRKRNEAFPQHSIVSSSPTILVLKKIIIIIYYTLLEILVLLTKNLTQTHLTEVHINVNPGTSLICHSHRDIKLCGS